ncbi:MRPL29 [Auxenochlorella protothecoides x Auxenochlorella symbiontica]
MAGIAHSLRQAPCLAALRGCARLSTSAPVRGLEELIVKAPKEGEAVVKAGRAWEAAELRLKSWDDLHALWFVLLKERNRLHAERMMHQHLKTNMPEITRYKKVKLSMNRIKQVMSQRALNEHTDPIVQAKLKAFINAL